MRVFISHAYADSDLAKVLSRHLEEFDFNVVTYQNTAPGEQISNTVEGLIYESDVTIFLVTGHSQNSEWMRQEVDHALKAWSQGTLFVVATRDAELPLGLRDLVSFRLSAPTVNIAELSMLAFEIARTFADTDETLASAATNDRVATQVQPPPRPPVFSAPPSDQELGISLPKSAVYGNGLSSLLTYVALAGLFLWLFSQFEFKLSIWPISVEWWPEWIKYTHALALIAPLAVRGLFRLLTSGVARATIELGGNRSKVHVGRSTPSISVERSANVNISVGESSKPDIFTSYSRKNLNTVSALVGSMRKFGLKVWIDTEKQTVSRRYSANISSAMRASRFVVLACSEETFKSNHVRRELYLAGDMDKDFVVVILEDVSIPDEFNYFLSGYPRIDAISASADEVGSEVRELLSA